MRKGIPVRLHAGNICAAEATASALQQRKRRGVAVQRRNRRAVHGQRNGIASTSAANVQHRIAFTQKTAFQKVLDDLLALRAAELVCLAVLGKIGIVIPCLAPSAGSCIPAGFPVVAGFFQCLHRQSTSSARRQTGL